jgi:hypothetical protein
LVFLSLVVCQQDLLLDLLKDDRGVQRKLIEAEGSESSEGIREYLPQ